MKTFKFYSAKGSKNEFSNLMITIKTVFLLLIAILVWAGCSKKEPPPINPDPSPFAGLLMKVSSEKVDVNSGDVNKEYTIYSYNDDLILDRTATFRYGQWNHDATLDYYFKFSSSLSYTGVQPIVDGKIELRKVDDKDNVANESFEYSNSLLVYHRNEVFENDQVFEQEMYYNGAGNLEKCTNIQDHVLDYTEYFQWITSDSCLIMVVNEQSGDTSLVAVKYMDVSDPAKGFFWRTGMSANIPQSSISGYMSNGRMVWNNFRTIWEPVVEDGKLVKLTVSNTSGQEPEAVYRYTYH